MKFSIRFAVMSLVLLGTMSNPAFAVEGKLESFTLSSKVLQDNQINLASQRSIKVWLPASYHETSKAYPVVYYIHSMGWNNTKLFSENRAGELFDHAFASGVSPEFIVVAGDFTTPGLGTFFGNNSVSGRWFDHIVDEVVPAIDNRYRTLAKPFSRGIAGDFLGGYAAIKMAMLKPNVFSSVYALHPVGTETGETLMRTRPNWQQMNTANSWEELTGFALPFMLMAQAHTPNPNKPPFYADLMVEMINGALTINDQNTLALHRNFLLSRWIPDHAAELRQLKGFMFDWGRYDENQDHVYSNQKFTRVLDEYGVAHQAEEYRGGAWDKNWIEHGRVADRLIPFFARHLDFD